MPCIAPVVCLLMIVLTALADDTDGDEPKPKVGSQVPGDDSWTSDKKNGPRAKGAPRASRIVGHHPLKDSEQACLDWSPDLKVKVNNTARAILIDVCVSGQPTWPINYCVSEASTRCQPLANIIHEGQCTAVVDGLRLGAAYNVTLMVGCPCVYKTYNWCPAKHFIHGPYEMISRVSDVRNNSFGLTFDKVSEQKIVLLFGFVAVSTASFAAVFTLVLFCCRRSKSNRSSRSSEFSVDDVIHPGIMITRGQGEGSPCDQDAPGTAGSETSLREQNAHGTRSITNSQTHLKQIQQDVDPSTYNQHVWQALDLQNLVLEFDDGASIATVTSSQADALWKQRELRTKHHRHSARSHGPTETMAGSQSVDECQPMLDQCGHCSCQPQRHPEPQYNNAQLCGAYRLAGARQIRPELQARYQRCRQYRCKESKELLTKVTEPINSDLVLCAPEGRISPNSQNMIALPSSLHH